LVRLPANRIHDRRCRKTSLIAAPLQLGQRALFPGFAGSGLTFAVRLVAVVLVVAGAAWLLERRIAPPLGRWIRRLGGAAAP
jgi:hypothetical protein